MIPGNAPQRAGRPRTTATPDEVRALRDNARLSWRAIARRLGIGTATVMRLYDAHQRGGKASQNSHEGGGG